MQDDNLLYHISLFTPTRFLTSSVESDRQYTLLLFFSGSGRCRAESLHAFRTGDVALLAPGHNVSFTCDEASAASIAIIQFPLCHVPDAHMEAPLAIWTQQYLAAARLNVWLHLPQQPLEELHALFHPLYAEYSAPQPSGGALGALLLDALLGWLARFYHLQQPPAQDSKSVPRGSELVEYARRIIALEFAEPLTLDAVARRCFVTSAYLSGLFHEKTGLSFNRYLNLTRVSHACRLLLDTDELAVDIGEASGFGSTPHFNLTFRKLTGFTPLEYRRRFKRPVGGVQADEDSSAT